MRRLIELVARVFRRKWWPAAVSIVAFVLVSPTIAAGYFLDDLIHIFVLEGNVYPGGPRGAWDLYHFADAGPGTRAAIDQGLYPWWSSPDLKLAFFRPLSSLWRAGEHALFGRVAWPAHLTTCLLYAALAYGVARMYRRLLGAGAVAGLAALLYAVDDAHSLSVVWIANRHALLAGALGLLVVGMHTKRVDEGRASWPSALVLAVALLAGETALGAVGYVVAYELVARRASLRQKLASLAPHTVVLGVWAAVYKLGGYGGGGNAFYLDPVRDPVAYLAALPGRFAKLTVGQLFVPPSEMWGLAPLPSWVTSLVALTLGAALVWLLARATRGHAAVPWLALGAALSLLPLTATLPDDRLLVMPGFGAMAVVAVALGRAARAWVAGDLGRVGRTAVTLFGALHLVLAPLLLPVRAMNVPAMFGGFTTRASASLPRGDAVAGKEVVVVATVDSFATSIALIDRYYLQSPPGQRPRKTRILAVQQGGSVTIRRDGPNALVLEATPGMYRDLFSTVYRRDAFREGEEAHAGGMNVRVLAVDAQNRVTRLRFESEEALEEKICVVYEGRSFVAIAPPTESTPRVVEEGTFFEAIQP